MTFSFGQFTLNPASRSLACRGHVRELSEKLFLVLLLLVRARGETVSKQTFFDAVWSGQDVSDSTLVQHIYMLRAILKEYDAERPYILTVNSRGYRFAADVHLAETALPRSNRPHDDDAAVIPLCCIGNQLLEKRSPSSIHLAQRYFEEALALKQQHAPALLGQARGHALLGEYMYVPPAAAFSQAKALIADALAIDPQSADGYALHAEIALFSDWDFSRAHEMLLAALDLDPDSLLARQNLVWLSLCAGDFDAALARVHDAMQRFPFTLALLYLLGRVQVHRGDYQAARRSFASILEIDSSFVLAIEWLALALLFDGRPDDCLRQLRDRRDTTARDLLYLEARALAESGDKNGAQSVLHEMRTHRKEAYVPTWYIACVEAGLGMKSEATEHLEMATSSREIPALFSSGLPMFTDL